jgi:hypothetical protein
VINDKVAFDGSLPEQMFMTQVFKALGMEPPSEE